MVSRGRGWGVGEGGGGTEWRWWKGTNFQLQDKKSTSNEQHDEYNWHCFLLYGKAVTRGNPEFSSQEKYFFSYFFNVVSLWDVGCSLNLPWSSLHDVMWESNHHAVRLVCGAPVLYVNYISIKMEEKIKIIKYFFRRVIYGTTFSGWWASHHMRIFTDFPGSPLLLDT